MLAHPVAAMGRGADGQARQRLVGAATGDLEQVLPETEQIGPVVGMHQLQPQVRMVAEFAGLVAEHGPPALGIMDLVFHEIIIPDRVGRAQQRQAQPLLGFLQALLGFLERGAVGEAYDHPAQAALVVQFGVGVADYPAYRIRLGIPDADHLLGQLASCAQYRVDRKLFRLHGAAVGTEQLPGLAIGAHTAQLRKAAAGQFTGKTVGVQDTAVDAMHDDARRQVLEQLVEPALQIRGSTGSHDDSWTGVIVLTPDGSTVHHNRAARIA